MPSKRVAVLGAGPIGVETALALCQAGHDVQVYERGEVGGNVARWGHVRLFSPFGMNRSARGASLLRRLPDDADYLTGNEYLDAYLRPLSGVATLLGRIHERQEVLHVGRKGIGKNELIGGPRARFPFRLLLQTDGGEERVAAADIVVDCTGTYGNWNPMGNGNVPARGERRLRDRLHYELRDVAGSDRQRFEGKRVLLVGAGHSAATALDGLVGLPGTNVHWVARKAKPAPPIENDPLPERARLSRLASMLATGSEPRVRFHPRTAVEIITERGEELEVELLDGEGRHRILVDEILAHVGTRPDNAIYRELQVHECYASGAPMKLAAALLGDGSADCLTQASKGAETLRNPEPGFFILGAKSYGRNSNFLIRIGLEQVEELLTLIDGRERRERAS